MADFGKKKIQNVMAANIIENLKIFEIFLLFKRGQKKFLDCLELEKTFVSSSIDKICTYVWHRSADEEAFDTSIDPRLTYIQILGGRRWLGLVPRLPRRLGAR